MLRLSRINWKSLLEGLLWKIDKPKYFSKESLASIKSWLARVTIVSELQFLEKTTLDLE